MKEGGTGEGRGKERDIEQRERGGDGGHRERGMERKTQREREIQ